MMDKKGPKDIEKVLINMEHVNYSTDQFCR